MKIKIKTSLIQLEIEDETILDDGFVKRGLPSIIECVQTAVDKAIELHNKTKYELEKQS